MTEKHDDSIADWLSDLADGNSIAAAELWDRYFDRLVRLARNRLNGVPGRISDEEDIALSVFNSLCNGAAKGRFRTIQDRDALWFLLARITNQKAVDQIRFTSREKRGGGNVRGHSLFGETDEGGDFDRMAHDEPTPEFLNSMDEEYQRLLQLLPEDHRQIAVWRMEGYTTSEIAERVGLTERSVRRKLNHIQKAWATELEV